ncbi:MAG: rhodanese-like domain-containing protein [Deltaproteobacteria bacterium]|nr:rhodanese-like domain-containing protein [Deltaproteobacteria bacterium]
MNAKKALRDAAILAAIGVVAGISVNVARPNGIPLVAPARGVAQSAPEDAPGLGNLDLAGAKKAFDAGAVFIDARSEHEFTAGHIAGAHHLYYADFEAKGTELLAKLPFDKTIVTYCSGEDCNASDILARHLLDFGFERVRVFFGGWPAWQAAGYPAEGAGEAAPLFEPMGAK